MAVRKKRKIFMVKHETDKIVEGIIRGDRRALSRGITITENRMEGYTSLISCLYKTGGNAHIIGITGSSGTGKSTLIDKLAYLFNKNGKSVAVLAVDPSSPFSDGAILGDRIRMQKSKASKEIFIRSIASRGYKGGLAESVNDIITILNSSGRNIILIETVGAGQSEIEIMKVAHTTVVVAAPGFGDEVQAQKAGIMEIADIFVVNKSDLPSAQTTANQIHLIMETEKAIERKQIPVILTSAIESKGIDEVAEILEKRWETLNKTGERINIEKSNSVNLLYRMVQEKLRERVDEIIKNDSKWVRLTEKVMRNSLSHEEAVSKYTEGLLKPISAKLNKRGI